MSIEDRKRIFNERMSEYNYKEDLVRLQNITESKALKEEQDRGFMLEAKRAEAININKRYNDWCTTVKNSLLFEAVYAIYSESFGKIKVGMADAKYDSLKRNLVSSFIESQDSPDEILTKCEFESDVLSNISLLIANTFKTITEQVKKDDESTFVIDTLIKDDFFDKLEKITPEDVLISIRSRVTDAVEDFITQNTADKLDIKDIIQQAQEKIEASTTDSVKESYNLAAKRKLSSVYNRPKNILGSMIYNLSEAATTNDAIRALYVESNGKLDLEKITETCEVIYAFLETINTIRLAHFNETDIHNILEDIKK